MTMVFMATKAALSLQPMLAPQKPSPAVQGRLPPREFQTSGPNLGVPETQDSGTASHTTAPQSLFPRGNSAVGLACTVGGTASSTV
jgi:hypothetical protein